MGRSKIYNYSKEELQLILDSSNSYVEVLRKVGVNGSSSTTTLKRIIQEYNLDTSIIDKNRAQKMSQNAHNQKQMSYEDFLQKLHKNSSMNSHQLRNKLIKFGFKEQKCESCGLTEWMGNPIKLELHHIDGDHYNNELENLQILCPNCHSLTSNYGVYNSTRYTHNRSTCTCCGKEIRKNKSGLCFSCFHKHRYEHSRKANPDVQHLKIKDPYYYNKELCPICKTNYKDKRSNMCINCMKYERKTRDTLRVSRDELKDLVRSIPFTQIAQMYNVSDNTVRKWCDKYHIPKHRNKIKNLTDEQWVAV